MLNNGRNQIKVLLFDVDGVLVNVNGKYFSQHLAEDYGIATEVTKEFFETEHQDCLVGTKDLKEVLPKYLKRWGWKGTVNDLMNYWYTSEHIINDELLKELHVYKDNNIKMYLATNQDKYRIGYILKEMEFSNVVDGEFSSASVGYKKPFMEYYVSVLNSLDGYSRNEILFWDDSLENVEMARTLGMNAEHFKDNLNYKSVMEKNYSL